MNENYSNYAMLFKALSDENRIRIMDYLKQGECCACKILEQLHITQPTLSHHMKILSDANLVAVRKEGKWIHYTLNHKRLHEIEEFIQMLLQQSVFDTNQQNDRCCF